MAISGAPAHSLGPLSLLAGCIAASLGVVPQSATAAPLSTTVYVDRCDQGVANADDTHGSLRWAVANVADGGTIDMTGLNCSSITLQNSGITIAQNDLTILGPGQGSLTITGYTFNPPGSSSQLQDRLFNHTGSGTLSMYDMTVTKGYLKRSDGTAPQGGCIVSAGNVYLKNVEVKYCRAVAASDAQANGGGVYTYGNLRLESSTLVNNTASTSGSGNAQGGGAYVNGNLYATGATVDRNYATGSHPTAFGYGGYGGGLVVNGDVTLVSSTVSRNVASGSNGGLQLYARQSDHTDVYIIDSTISGNSAALTTGGMISKAPTTYLFNSTIAFNTAGFGQFDLEHFAPGLALFATSGSILVNLQSTLLSNNTYASTENDLSTVSRHSYTTTFNSGPANNLVRAALETGLPNDTIEGACPLLGPLRDNGGATETHRLYSSSPAIDSGNIPPGDYYAVIDNLQFDQMDYDQRGAAFVRVSNGTADIGAYEVQHDDELFDASFEGCAALPP